MFAQAEPQAVNKSELSGKVSENILPEEEYPEPSAKEVKDTIDEIIAQDEYYYKTNPAQEEVIKTLIAEDNLQYKSTPAEIEIIIREGQEEYPRISEEELKSIIEEDRVEYSNPRISEEELKSIIEEDRVEYSSHPVDIKEEIDKIDEFRIKYASVTAPPAWWKRVITVASRPIGNTFVLGIVQSFAINAASVKLMEAVPTALGFVTGATGLGAMGVIGVSMGVYAVPQIAMAIYDQWDVLAVHPLTGVKMVAKRVVGKVLLKAPSIIIGTIFPSFMGKMAGGIFSGILSNIVEKTSPTTEAQAKMLEMEQLYAMARSMQDDLKKRYGDFTLEELNGKKASLCWALAAKALSVATTATIIGAVVAGATTEKGRELGRQIFTDLFIEWRNGNPYVAPVINGVISDNVFPLMGVYKATGYLGKLTRKLIEKIPGGNYHVTHKSVRKFFKERVGVEGLEDLTFAALFEMGATLGANIYAFNVLSGKVQEGLALTKKWESIDEAMGDARNFYDSALQKSMDYARTAASAPQSAARALGEAFASGASAMTPQAGLGRIYNPQSKSEEGKTVKEGLDIMNEATKTVETATSNTEFQDATRRALDRVAERTRRLEETMNRDNAQVQTRAFNEARDRAMERVADRTRRLDIQRDKDNEYNAGEPNRNFNAAVNRAMGRTAARSANLNAQMEAENLENASAALGVQFGTVGALRQFQGDLGKFAGDNPQGYNDIKNGKIPSYSAESLAGHAIGSLSVMGYYNKIRDATYTLGSMMRIGSWGFRGISTIQTLSNSLRNNDPPEVRVEEVCARKDPFGVVPEQCGLRNEPKENEVRANEMCMRRNLFSVVPEQCGLMEPREIVDPASVINMLPAFGPERTSAMGRILGRSADFLMGINSLLPPVGNIAPVEINPWRVAAAAYGGFSIGNVAGIVNQGTFGDRGAAFTTGIVGEVRGAPSVPSVPEVVQPQCDARPSFTNVFGPEQCIDERE